MKIWRPPLLFTLEERKVVRLPRGGWYWELTWVVAWSDGINHHPLGECRRTTSWGPNHGAVKSWSAWPPGATGALKPSHSSLLDAGRELARRAGKKV